MNIFKHLSKRTVLFSLGVIITLGLAAIVPAIIKAGPGPDRPTKAYTDGVAGFDHVTFNSFTNVPRYGDERLFFTGGYEGGSDFGDPINDVRANDTLTLHVYVHNNADESLNANGTGIAKNTKVRVALPTGIAKSQQATAYISADNAQPKEVTDTVDFTGKNGELFQLEYVKGSAHIKGNTIDSALGDDIVSANGVQIGNKALDGSLEGCFKQMVYVTLQVKVKMPQYTLAKQVRMNGQTSADWTETKNVKAGDKVQWRLTFTNTGATSLKDIQIIDKVPTGLTVVPGSIKLINGNYPINAPFTYPDSSIQDSGRTINIRIGDYGPNSAGIAYVVYDTTVDKPADTVCSEQKLVNKAYASPLDMGAIWDDASVTVPGNTCAQPETKKPEYSCKLLDVTMAADRKVTANVTYTAQNATLKTVTYTWGDDSLALTTDKTSALHQYAKDGTYKVSAKLLFSADGKDVYAADSAECTKVVTITTPAQPAAPQPTTLPNTGVGSVIGIFGATLVASLLGYRVYLTRTLVRK